MCLRRVRIFSLRQASDVLEKFLRALPSLKGGGVSPHLNSCLMLCASLFQNFFTFYLLPLISGYVLAPFKIISFLSLKLKSFFPLYLHSSSQTDLYLQNYKSLLNNWINSWFYLLIFYFVNVLMQGKIFSFHVKTLFSN